MKTIKFYLLFSAAFLVGFGRFYFYTMRLEHNSLQKFIEKKIEGSATVVAEPDRRDNSLRLTIRIDSLSEKVFTDRGLVLITVDPYSNIQYGDQFNFSGVLQLPRNFKTDSGREFNYVRFLEKDGILYQLNKPTVKNISHDHGEWLESNLLKIKYSFLNHEAEVIPEPNLSLLGGLLLGTKQSLGKGLLDNFQKVGVIHMVVISGYNITIVAEAIASAFSFLPRLLGFSLSAGSVILFVLMTGASSASVRAAVMTIIAILGKLLRRKYDVMRALLFSALLMVFMNPLILVFDPSFQLSFGATLGLLVVSPVITPYAINISGVFKLRETIVSTVATQIFLLPFLLYQSGIFSMVALPVNLLVLFPVPFTMLIGFLTGLLSFINLPLALALGFVSNFLLSYILFVVTTAAKQSFAAVSIPIFSFKIVVLVYFLYAVILLKLHRRNASRSPPNLDFQKMHQHTSSYQLERSQG